MADWRVLIVEDDTTARNALTELLSEEGFDVRSASRGDEAVTLSSNWSPQIVVVDYNLPDSTGIQVAASVRKHHEGCAVIVMTGTAELIHDRDGVRFNDREAESLAAGAIAYLPKPIDFDALLGHLRRFFAQLDD